MGTTGLQNVTALPGCTDPNFAEYNPDATSDDGTCLTFNWTVTSLDVTIPGYVDWEFTDGSTGGTPTEWLWDFGDQATSTEQNPTHRYTESGQYAVTLTASNEWGSTEFTQDIEIEIDVPGCMDPAYVEYNSTVTVDDNSCLTVRVDGCMNDQYQEYNPDANVEDGSCLTPIGQDDQDDQEIYGCTDPAYQEYNPDATSDDGSCRTLGETSISGCMDPAYQEYNPDATADDGSCRTLIQQDIIGCMDNRYQEYNSDATVHVQGDCKTLTSDSSEFTTGIQGCMDPKYMEYDPYATEDDGTWCKTLLDEK
jgi:PKD repeat protein